MTPPGIEVRGPAVVGRCPHPDRRRARVRRGSSATVRGRPSRSPPAAPGAPGRARCRRSPGVPPGHARHSRGSRLAGGADSGRPRGSACRDHRAGRGQDDDQRPELRGARLHGRPRGRPLTDVGERRRRPGRDRGRDARRAHLRVAGGKVLSTRRADRRRSSCGRAAGTWSSRTSSSMVRRSRRRSSISGCISSIRARPRSSGEAARTCTSPKLESHREAHLWNEVFVYAQTALGIPRGTIRATVLIETILAAFEMDEILYELREHAAGLNAGRWDYLFSIIKKFRTSPDLASPDRAQLTMTVPFMRAYTELLVQTCHRRGAHAIGGMAAFIPNRRDPEVTERAMARVRDDKERESGDGFDGTWVAHPDLVPLATEIFDGVLGDAPHQKGRVRAEVATGSDDLLDFRVEGGRVTEAGVRANVRVALAYLDSWLRGIGAAAIDNLMEDAATAEISPVAAVAVDHPVGRSREWVAVRRRAICRDPGRGAGPARRGGIGPAGRGGRAAGSARPRRRLRRLPDPSGLLAPRVRRRATLTSPRRRGRFSNLRIDRPRIIRATSRTRPGSGTSSSKGGPSRWSRRRQRAAPARRSRSSALPDRAPPRLRMGHAPPRGAAHRPPRGPRPGVAGRHDLSMRKLRRAGDGGVVLTTAGQSIAPRST